MPSGLSWHTYAAIFVSVVIAGSLFAFGWWSLAVIVPILLASAAVGLWARQKASRALPCRPLDWDRWVKWTALVWFPVLTAASATALYLAARIGEKLTANAAGPAGLGFAAVVGVVKVLDKVADDDDWVDKSVATFAKRSFQHAYRSQLEKGGPFFENEVAHTAILVDQVYEGWTANGRKTRASHIASLVKQLSPITWR